MLTPLSTVKRMLHQHMAGSTSDDDVSETDDKTDVEDKSPVDAFDWVCQSSRFAMLDYAVACIVSSLLLA